MHLYRGVADNPNEKKSVSGENVNKIVLGLALCFHNLKIFECFAERQATAVTFKQDPLTPAEKRETQSLLELALKAAIVAGENMAVTSVMQFCHANKYIAKVDEEAIWWAVL